MKHEKQLVAKEFRTKDNTSFYFRYESAIDVSVVLGRYKVINATIYKNGTFDLKIVRGPTDEKVKKGLKNTLIRRYNYDSIMDSFENKRKSDLQNFNYIYNLIHKFFKIAGVDLAEL